MPIEWRRAWYKHALYRLAKQDKANKNGHTSNRDQSSNGVGDRASQACELYRPKKLIVLCPFCAPKILLNFSAKCGSGVEAVWKQISSTEAL